MSLKDKIADLDKEREEFLNDAKEKRIAFLKGINAKKRKLKKEWLKQKEAEIVDINAFLGTAIRQAIVNGQVYGKPLEAILECLYDEDIELLAKCIEDEDSKLSKFSQRAKETIEQIHGNRKSGLGSKRKAIPKEKKKEEPQSDDIQGQVASSSSNTKKTIPTVELSRGNRNRNQKERRQNSSIESGSRS